MARDGGGDGLAPSYGSSFFRLCCLNWFVMKIRPSWKSVSETMALAIHSPRTRRPRVLLHELAVRGDRVIADGLDG